MNRLFCIIALFAVTAIAQDTRPAEEQARYRFRVRHVEMSHNIVYLVEDVEFRIGLLDLRADTVVVWLADGAKMEDLAEKPPKDAATLKDWSRIARRFVKEIYLDGNVVVRQGEEVTLAAAAYFDFEHDRGIILDAATTYPLPAKNDRQDLRLNIRAEELRILTSDRLEAIGVKATLCPFGHPHYHLGAEKLEVIRKTAPPLPPEAGGVAESRPREGIEYSVTDPTFRLGNTGLFWLPDLSGDTTDPNMLGFATVRDVRVGSSGEYGQYLGTTVGGNINLGGERWGTWDVLTDWRSKRGWGSGIDLSWKTPDYRGSLETYYQRDHGTDRLYGRPDTRDRGRISFAHRHKLPWELQLDVELNTFSDRNFYPTYYDPEYRNEKPPETYAYLLKRGANTAASALFSTRMNDWETGTYYEPKFDWTMIAEPIAEIGANPLYFTTRVEAARLDRKFDEAITTSTFDTTRIDVDTLFEYPFPVDIFKVTPFVGLRTTWYEEDLLGRSNQIRTGLTWGAEVSTQAWKIMDAEGGIFGLDGVRHIVRPTVRWQQVTGVSLEPSELVYYDATDTLEDANELTFELRNLFQTRRKIKGETVVDDFLDLRLEMTWRPDVPRHLGDIRPEWGPLYSDNVVRFSERLEFLTDFEVDLEQGWIPSANAAIGYKVDDGLKTYAGIRHLATQWDVVFGQINWQATDKWLLRAYGDYDFNDGRGIENVVALTRLGDDAVFTIEFRANYARDDIGVNFVFNPRAFFDPILENRRGYLDPRFQFLGDGIHK